MSDFGDLGDLRGPVWPSIESMQLSELQVMSDDLRAQSTVLGQLVELARLEHEARLTAEASTRRWQWATFGLGVVTLAAAVAAIFA